MDILQFVNSKAIRNYLKEIHYSFSTLEAAWMIYQSKNRSIEEMNAANWASLTNSQSRYSCHKIRTFWYECKNDFDRLSSRIDH